MAIATIRTTNAANTVLWVVFPIRAYILMLCLGTLGHHLGYQWLFVSYVNCLLVMICTSILFKAIDPDKEIKL